MQSRLSLSDTKRALSRVRYFSCTVLALTFIAAAGSESQAQIRLPSQGGIPVGKFLFYPSVKVDFGYTSNVLLSSEEVGAIPSGVFVARLNLKMDMPLGAHHIRWSYAPQYKGYTTDQFVNDALNADPISHFFDFESRFQVGRSFSIGFIDHIVRGVTELQDVLPGGEQVFGLTPFRLHEPSLNLEFRLGTRQRIVVTPRYAQARFDGAGAASFFSYNTEAIEARYGYQVSAPSELFVFLLRQETEQVKGQYVVRGIAAVDRGGRNRIQPQRQ